jgi:pimeloyl-ACP methyl ester carboxylesterase
MTPSTEIERLAVRSPDGVELAVWFQGQGPPLVLVHGSIQNHTVSAALVEALRTDFTTYAMDRRGFGASGDGPSYCLDREFADVAAVVDEVAARTGSRVVLWGHSFGASCAMGAATLTENVSHLLLYEPSLGLPYPTGWIDQVERLVAAGDLETAIVMVLRDLLEFTDEQIEQRRAEPAWAGRVATAPTVAREARAEQEWTYAGNPMRRIVVPTLLLSGSDSPPDIKQATMAARAAIPGAQVRVLAGHAHIAHRTDPDLVAGIVREFVTT